MSTPGIKHPVPPIWGTWKLRSVEEHSQTPMPGLQTSIAIFTHREDGIHYLSDPLFSNGLKTHVESSLRLDGRTYPITGSMFGDQVSAKQVGLDTIQAEIRREGRVSASVRFTVQDAGTILISEWEIVPEQGATVTFSTISDRQP